MIDESVLTRLVAEAAHAAPEPSQSPEDLVDTLGQEIEPQEPKRRGLRVVAVAAALLVAGGLVVVVSGAETVTDSNAQRAVGPSLSIAPPNADVVADGRSRSVANSGARSEAVARSGNTAATSALDQASPQRSDAALQAPSATPPADSARVVKTGAVALEVKEGAFGATVDRIVASATGLGGYVSESTTNESDDVPNGSITIRVPASSFDEMVADLRGLGEVEELVSKGTDVTSQFTDLAARLSALTATRDRLLTVLAGASTVADIIAVQDRITGVQTEIERIQGQQRQLDDQASFGTIAVTLAEPGIAVVAEDDEPQTGLAAAWADARERFGNSIESIVAWSGSASVVLLVALLLLGLARIVWLNVRRRLV